MASPIKSPLFLITLGLLTVLSLLLVNNSPENARAINAPKQDQAIHNDGWTSDASWKTEKILQEDSPSFGPADNFMFKLTGDRFSDRVKGNVTTALQFVDYAKQKINNDVATAGKALGKVADNVFGKIWGFIKKPFS